MKRFLQLSPVIIFLILLLRFQIYDILIHNFGVCSTATLSNTTRSIKYKRETMLYKFRKNQKIYEGDSGIEYDSSKVGTKICVKYLSLFPSITQPINQSISLKLDDCNCNIY